MENRNASIILEFLNTRSNSKYHFVKDAFKNYKLNPNPSEISRAILDLAEYIDILPLSIKSKNPKARINSRGVKYLEDKGEKLTDQNLKRQDINVRKRQINVAIATLILGILSFFYIEFCKSEINEVLPNITDTSQSSPLKKDTTGDLPPKIVDISSEYQFVKLFIKNEQNNPKYIKQINLKILQSDSLRGLISPAFSQPRENKLIQIELNGRREYLLKPNMYLPPKEIEVFKFNIFHLHNDPQFEFIKLLFEIEDDSNFKVQSDTFYHFIGVEDPIVYANKNLKSIFEPLNKKLVNRLSKTNLYRTYQFEQVIKNFMKRDSFWLWNNQ